MTKEIWKQIKGFDGYSISSEGRVKSVKFRGSKQRVKILRPFKSKHKSAYFQLALSNRGKVAKKTLHSLLANAFLTREARHTEINHKNGDRLDNRLDNLEWVTHLQNILHARKKGLTPQRTFTKVTKKQVKEIRRLYKDDGMLLREIAPKFGIAVSTVSHIIRGYTWKDV